MTQRFTSGTGESEPRALARAGGGVSRRFMPRHGLSRRALLVSAAVAGIAGLLGFTGGCVSPRVLAPDQRKPIDRKFVEAPGGFDLEKYADGLNGPVAISFDGDGNLIVAEGGLDGSEPHIYGFTPEQKRFEIYPYRRPIIALGKPSFQLHGPIGGIVCHQGTLYVSHRDADDLGVISALDYKGGHRTVVAGLPASGEHGVTGLAIDPLSGRLFFGIGSATNAGLVGPDDLELGWVKKHPGVHDIPYRNGKEGQILLWGRRMNSPNPSAWGLMPDLAVTGPFQPFGNSSRTRIPAASPADPKCNSAICSVRTDGGELKVEAWGIRLPKGLVFNSFGRLYFTNQGMELRGSRPVKDDPDSLLYLFPTNWYGWPDYSTDLRPITEDGFQPPAELIVPTGYPDLSFLVNHQASDWIMNLKQRDTVFGVMPSQSGASGVDFVPDAGPFSRFRGSAIVALFGDRTPFSTSSRKTTGPIGFKVVQIDLSQQTVTDFVRNVKDGPASKNGGDTNQLERPIDVKFGPDGALYILDFGIADVVEGKYRVKTNTGRIYRLIPGK